MLMRFTGLESHIGEIRLGNFGMLIDIDPKLAHDAVLGQVGLLPPAEFDAAGFTEDELDSHTEYDSHRDLAPDDPFAVKKAACHKAAAAFRVQYEKDSAMGKTFMSPASAEPTVRKPKPAQESTPTPTPVV